MDYGQLIDVVLILVNLVGLMLCLFKYFEHTGKTLTFAVTFFLGNLLSNYYWGVYILVMNDSPNVSSMLAYFGWNLAFPALFFMMYYLRKEKGRGMVSPLALLVIPINAAQLVLYLRFGGLFNNIWQVSWTTAVVVLALDMIVFYINNRKQGENFPFIGVAVFLYIFLEYASWTISCFDWPAEKINPYDILSTLICLCYLLIPAAVSKEYGQRPVASAKGRFMRVFKPLFIVIAAICCVGGYFLAVWMRDIIAVTAPVTEGSDPYSIIVVMLFIVSAVIVSFTIMIIMVVDAEKKHYEKEEIEKARYLAEKANTAKSDFLANMSHEIRTPINAVLGMNEIIFRESLQARDDLPENRGDIKKVFSDISNYSGNIESAGKNLLSIINDILDFSKIEAGKMEIVKSKYYLSSVINDVSNMIRFKAQNKGLDFEIDVNEKLPDALYGDEVRIRQVIINLLNNAVKYTHQGKVTLSVSEKKNRVNGEQISLVFTIKDTGIGIRDQDKERLFNKFERMDAEKNSNVEGTGLGLAITASLIEMMNGSISVNSKYGRGSTFTVTIPQEIISHEPIGDFRTKFEKSIGSMKAEKISFRASEANILVVDDTPMNLMVVKGLLKKTEINIDTAVNGPDAVKLAKRRRYDIIFMDQRMPGMEGTEAMRLIRGDLSGMNGDTPCICLTADAVSGAKERYLADGYEEYLSKPIDSHELEQMILRFLPADKVEFADRTEEAEKTTEGEAFSEEISAEGEETVNATADETPDGSQDVASDGASDPESDGPDEKKSDLVDRNVGLGYCDGDEDFYKEILSEYVSEFDDKLRKLEKAYDEKNWRDYGVYTHALKSTSRMVGAVEVSELALSQEKAAKKDDEDSVRKGHERLIACYRDTVRCIREKE